MNHYRTKQKSSVVLLSGDYCEGLCQVGLFLSGRNQEIWNDTPHADVCERVIRVCRDYLKVIAAETVEW
ncbi:MAG: hypothetical protein KC733_03905 [Candidatus Omnitrophica bacterium]|nr:hypothetical protein [Candidatus Omnitrophota bacterium]